MAYRGTCSREQIIRGEGIARKLAREASRKALASFRAEHADTIANAVVPWRLSDTKVVLMVFCLLYMGSYVHLLFLITL